MRWSRQAYLLACPLHSVHLGANQAWHGLGETGGGAGEACFRVPEVAQVIADGGRRPGPKARAEGARRRRLRKFWPFWTSLTHFPRKNSIPGGRLRRTAPAGAFGALPQRAPSAFGAYTHRPSGRLPPSAHTPTVQARQAARNVGGGGSNPEPHAFFFTHL